MDFFEYVKNGINDFADGLTGGSRANNSRLTAASQNLDTLKSQQPGNYQSAYASQISGKQNELNELNRKGFTYDYTRDNAYQQYKNRYTKGAELASEDASARAAARSGGYGNSWATSSGQTAYQNTMNGLSNAVDELYNQAYNEYTTKKSDLSNQIAALQNQEQLAQNAYNMNMNTYWNQLNHAQQEYNSASSDKQQETSNKINFWGNAAQLAAKVLPWVLSAL